MRVWQLRVKQTGSHVTPIGAITFSEPVFCSVVQLERGGVTGRGSDGLSEAEQLPRKLSRGPLDP